MAISREQLLDMQTIINKVWDNYDLIENSEVQNMLTYILRKLEMGELRVITPQGTEANYSNVSCQGNLKNWIVHSWIKQAILLVMRYRNPKMLGEASDSLNTQGRIYSKTLVWYDKLDIQNNAEYFGYRTVPTGIVREGAFVGKGAIIMPSFVNIGAYVGLGSMVDTWATVGSCAQIGNNVHLAGGVGIGGVLEPINAKPVIIGDNAFIGSRSIIVEGAVIDEQAVLGANVCITSSTPIYDVTTNEKIEYRGYVPPRAVVAPGTRAKKFPGGEVQLSCAYIIAYRSEQTDNKVSLNNILRETGLSV